jgi:hypothetical protein
VRKCLYTDAERALVRELYADTRPQRSRNGWAAKRVPCTALPQAWDCERARSTWQDLMLAG